MKPAVGTDYFIGVAQQAMWVLALASAPILIPALVAGLILGMVQAATSINEQTLAFVPKLIIVAICIALFGGAIVTLGGTQSLSGAARRVHGSVAKHGLVGLTRGLAREFADRGIRANCIAPGQMDTTRANARAARAPVDNIPLKRKGDPEEIATTVRFLCGPAASYITGQTLYVNGGQTMT